MEYNATLEIATRVKTHPAAAEQLIEQLPGFSAAASTSPFGRLEVTLTVQAASLDQAGAVAVAVVEKAAGRPALTLSVMSTVEYDRRLGVPEVPELVSVSGAASRLGITRQRVQQLIDAETLPATRAGSTQVVPLSAVVALANDRKAMTKVLDPDDRAGRG